MENTAKLEAIKKSYGEHWDSLKEFVNENGWCDLLKTKVSNPREGVKGLKMQTMDEYHPRYCYWKRPESISGIENNNGWVSILSEADLPKHLESKKIIFRAKEGTTTTYFSEDIVSEIPNHFLRYSHWRLKTEIPDPIY